MGTKNLKSLMSALFLASYIPSVAAQTSIVGSGNPQATVVEFFNEMVFYGFEAGSVAEITLFFVAPLFAFYMINKNIFRLGFESFEDRIGRSSYNITSDQKDLPTGLKGLALAVAFLTVQVIGLLGTFMLLALTGLAYVTWILHWVGLFGDFSSSIERGSGGGNASQPPSDTESGDEIDQELQDELDEVAAENEELREELEQIRGEQQEDETGMESGQEGPDEAEEDIERENLLS